MSAGLQLDFTKGSIPRHLVTFALPMLASNLLQISQNVIDTIWVGRFVGTHALGTVSTSFPLIFALLSLVIGLTIATSVLVAQYRGAGNEQMVRRTVANSLMLLSLGGMIVAIAGVLFRYPLLRLISTPPEVLEGAAGYLGIFMGGLPVIFLYYAVEAIMRGLGNSRTPLRFMAVATITNIILDPLLIAGIGPFPRMGVAGAALATVLSQALTSSLLVWWLLKHTDLVQRDRAFWRFDREIVQMLFRIGLPAGLQMVLVSFSMVFVTAMINVYGPVIVAAFGAASRFDH
ncbi:MAG TPA: MATE family efflux transporter, partial [Symbiobacteriaceae bacterium]|nr:MATE family efflux transporter [Symbiobacteriaceae bacterium]